MEKEIVAIFEKVKKACNVSYRKLAEMLSSGERRTTKQSLNRMVHSGSLRMATFLEILDVLGMGMKICKNGNTIYETGEGKNDSEEGNSD